MNIAVGADKGGLKVKEYVCKALIEDGHTIVDYGTLSEDAPKAHSGVAEAVAKEVQKKSADIGILFCGTGMGMAITANKFKGIQAGVVESVFTAKHCRLINDCNVLCLGGYILGEVMALEMAKAFISTGFATNFIESRREYLQREIDHIAEIEDQNFK